MSTGTGTAKDLERLRNELREAWTHLVLANALAQQFAQGVVIAHSGNTVAATREATSFYSGTRLSELIAETLRSTQFAIGGVDALIVLPPEGSKGVDGR